MIDATRSRVVPRIVKRSWLAGALTATVGDGGPCRDATYRECGSAGTGGGGTRHGCELRGSGGNAVVNTGSTVVTGDLGVSPGASVSGFPPGSVSGATHVADAVAAQAQADLTTAYNDAASQAPAATVPTELGGTTLTPGIYKSTAGTFQITGNLTLDAQGDPNAVFIFQTDLLPQHRSRQHGDPHRRRPGVQRLLEGRHSATLGASSSFTGNILALNSISTGSGAAVKGRTLARTGLVTLNKATVTPSVCQAPPGNGETPPGTAEIPPGAMQTAPCLPGQGGQFAFTIPVEVLSTAIPPGSVAFSAPDRFWVGPSLTPPAKSSRPPWIPARMRARASFPGTTAPNTCYAGYGTRARLLPARPRVWVRAPNTAGLGARARSGHGWGTREYLPLGRRAAWGTATPGTATPGTARAAVARTCAGTPVRTWARRSVRARTPERSMGTAARHGHGGGWISHADVAERRPLRSCVRGC